MSAGSVSAVDYAGVKMKFDAEKYGRKITLVCPTCGGSDFLIPDTSEEPVSCVQCGRTIMRDDLVRENSENVQAHLEDVQTEIVRDIRKEFRDSLRRAFQGNKYIRFK